MKLHHKVYIQSIRYSGANYCKVLAWSRLKCSIHLNFSLLCNPSQANLLEEKFFIELYSEKNNREYSTQYFVVSVQIKASLSWRLKCFKKLKSLNWSTSGENAGFSSWCTRMMGRKTGRDASRWLLCSPTREKGYCCLMGANGMQACARHSLSIQPIRTISHSFRW